MARKIIERKKDYSSNNSARTYLSRRRVIESLFVITGSVFEIARYAGLGMDFPCGNYCSERGL